MRERNNTKEIKKFFSSILRKEEEEEDVIIVDVSIVVSTLYPLPSTLYPREKAIKSASLASPILFKVRTSLIIKAK
jgi:hypothetical protein